MLLHVTLCYIVFHDCIGRSVSGGSGRTPSWFVQSLPTSTERSQKLCDHLTTSLVWGTSMLWNELAPNIWEHLWCTCLESRSKKSKVIWGIWWSNRGHTWKQNVSFLSRCSQFRGRINLVPSPGFILYVILVPRQTFECGWSLGTRLHCMLSSFPGRLLSVGGVWERGYTVCLLMFQ